MAQFACAKLAGARLAEVEQARFRRFQGQYLDHMRPTQLCSQCRHNSEIRELLGKLHHAAQVACLESAPVAGAQLCRQRRHNLPPVLRALVVQDFVVDLLSDTPEQKYCGAVRLTSQDTACFLNQAGYRRKEIAWRWKYGGVCGFFTNRHRCHPHQGVQLRRRPMRQGLHPSLHRREQVSSRAGLPDRSRHRQSGGRGIRG